MLHPFVRSSTRTRPEGGGLQGVEAVIDKDLCSALIATELQVDCLIIATDVDAVYLDWGLPTQRGVGQTTPEALSAHAFAAGSMAPKIEAACGFVRASGRRAAIGAFGDIEALLAGHRGTQIVSASTSPSASAASASGLGLRNSATATGDRDDST